MLLVGLTGGIASGKSLVSGCFHELGAPVIDADVLAREVVTPGSPGLNALIRHFTTAILTPKGELDRAALRRIVFANPPDREFLDRTLHPLIREKSDQRMDALRQEGHPYAIYAVPLLVETKQQERFDRIVVVDVPEPVQLQRLLARDGSTEAEAKGILAAQASREDRLAVADDVIDNAGTIEQTRMQVTALHRKYTAADEGTNPVNDLLE
jgi:dephospho-CoA kinase